MGLIGPIGLIGPMGPVTCNPMTAADVVFEPRIDTQIWGGFQGERHTHP